MFIVVAVAALRVAPGSRQALAGLQRDEWRRQSTALATRDAFIVVLVAQPVLAFLLAQASVAAPLAVMACASVLLGIATLLASLLLRDR